MKMKCWVCAVLGLLLLQAHLRAADSKPGLPLVKKGHIVRVSETEVVVKSKDEKQGEVSYPLKEVSQNVRLSDDELKKQMAEMKTREKYVAAPKFKVADLQPGAEVRITYGSSHVKAGDKVIEDGNYYQIEVLKLAGK